MSRADGTRRRQRLPAWWEQGEDPDYRFSLANERTSLAWIRTSLALLAASVGAVQLLSGPERHVIGAALSISLALAGALAALLACLRWNATERAMREHRRLAYGPMVAVLAVLSATLILTAAAVIGISLTGT